MMTRAPPGAAAVRGLSMEALVLTLAVAGLMAAALVLLGRTWPRSSRAGGYRAGRGAGAEPGGPAARSADDSTNPPEDDEARWSWPDDDPGQRRG